MKTEPSRNKGMAAALLLMAAAILGCSSAEDKFYDAYKCGRVANMIGNRKEATSAARKAQAIVQDLPEKYRANESQFLLLLSTRLTDDLALYKLSPAGQGKAIMDAHDSGTCQKLYQ